MEVDHQPAPASRVCCLQKDPVIPARKVPSMYQSASQNAKIWKPECTTIVSRTKQKKSPKSGIPVGSFCDLSLPFLALLHRGGPGSQKSISVPGHRESGTQLGERRTSQLGASHHPPALPGSVPTLCCFEKGQTVRRVVSIVKHVRTRVGAG